ncbi:RNA polymerase Rpc34 [Gigaspora margarita]|uniref:RNA polymerase Rpc34 n=1 Tax=Gigaspora margarita TaxID=4874 RepID=A0A8H4AFD6_GIGMA|nr:RNA polymerase Rpc34 [Gigaspora margarita]
MEVTEEELTVHKIILEQGPIFVDEIKIHELIEYALPDTSWEQLQIILESLHSFGLVRKRQTHDERVLYQARTKEIAKKLQNLDEKEFEIYELIENSERKGIAKSEIQKLTKIVQSIVESSLKSMQDQQLVKEVKPKNKKLYMLFDIKPADESLSRLLYNNGEVDILVVEALKTLCYNFIYHRSFPKDMDEDAVYYPGYTGYPTLPKILQCVIESKLIAEVEVEDADIRQILDVLIYEGKIIRIFSGAIPDSDTMDIMGTSHGSQEMYVARKQRAVGNAWTPPPCGRCPYFKDECTEDGEISPSNCVFYPQWLNRGISIAQETNRSKGKGKNTMDW